MGEAVLTFIIWLLVVEPGRKVRLCRKKRMFAALGWLDRKLLAGLPIELPCLLDSRGSVQRRIPALSRPKSATHSIADIRIQLLHSHCGP
jgi:hypothetical protein